MKNYLVLTITQEGFSWHNEDDYLAGKKRPVYAVADGVTMPAIEEAAEPSASKKAATIFCREAVKFTEENYSRLSLKILKAAFKEANGKAREMNEKRDYKLTAVAAVAAVKNGRIFGARLTDCGLALIRAGKIIFKTPEFWTEIKKKGKTGYGVIGKDDNQLKYIDFYTWDYRAGDFLVLFSDGFENHFSRKDFVSALNGDDLKEIEKRLKEEDEKLIIKDEEKYGHERTILLTKLN